MAHKIVKPPPLAPNFEYSIITGSSDDLDGFCQAVVSAVANGYLMHGPTSVTLWMTREVTDSEDGSVYQVPVMLYSQSIVRVPKPTGVAQAMQLPPNLIKPGMN